MYYVGFASLIVAMGVTWVVTPGVIRLANRLGAVDLPGHRKIHSVPIPRIGGLAVFFGFVGGLSFAAWVTGNLPTVQGVYWRGLAFAATGLLLVGLFDDLWGLSFRWKFAAQIVAAIYVWNCGFQIEILTRPLGGGTLDLGFWSLPVTVLWIVAVTNAVNLIDGLDGLAAGIALIVTIAVAVIGVVRSELGVTAASVALAGSLIGFLRYNFNPARIFLGDSGSLFLGFVLAVTSARGSQKGPTIVAVLVPLLILGLPLLDTGLAVVRRLYHLGRRGLLSDHNTLGYMGRNFTALFLPDRRHLHHRLLDLGLSHRRAVLTLYLVGALFAAAALGLVAIQSAWIATLLVLVLAGNMATFLALIYVRIWKQEARPADPEVSPPTPKTRTGSLEPLATSRQSR